MRHSLLAILFFAFPFFGNTQNFVRAYKEHRLAEVGRITHNKTKLIFQRFIKNQAIEVDTIFRAYKARTGFDFNSADSIFMIYEAPAESPFTSDVLIWSGNDTISYQQGFEQTKGRKFKRTITYGNFDLKYESPTGYTVITPRDSLITLVSRRDFRTIERLGAGSNIMDGTVVRIYVAYKQNGQYRIESCDPPKFMLWPVYRKE